MHGLLIVSAILNRPRLGAGAVQGRLVLDLNGTWRAR